MSLEHHLHIGAPLIWVTSDEPVRVLDTVCDSSERLVHRMDVFDKFVVWNPKRSMWERVMANNPESGDLEFIDDFDWAVKYVIDKRAVMVVEHAHLTAEALVSLYSAISHLYINAVRKDDADEIPPTFVLMSYSDKVPPEIDREVIKINFELPSVEVLQGLATHIGGNIAINEAFEAARAGRGMTEFEFTAAALDSLVSNQRLDPVAISKTKIETLSKSTVLEISQPELTLEDIGGLDRAKDLFSKVAWVWHNAETAAELGIVPIRRVLLVGVPGAGKSAVCEAVSRSLGLELAKAGVGKAMHRFVGDSEQNMRRTFRAVKVLAPIVLWIDEFGRDMSGSGSSNQTDGGTTDRVHAEFLTGLQELPESVMLMCAANRIEDLPPEMLRADRFDKIMFVGFPTYDERIEIFRIHLGAKALQYDLPKLAKATPFFTGAEIKALIRDVTFNTGAGPKHTRPTEDDFVKAAPATKGRVWVNHKEDIVKMYKQARIEWDWASSGQLAEADNVIGAKAAAHIVSKDGPQDFGKDSFRRALGE